MSSRSRALLGLNYYIHYRCADMACDITIGICGNSGGPWTQGEWDRKTGNAGYSANFIVTVVVHFKINILCDHEKWGTRSALRILREVDLLLAGPSILSLGQDVRNTVHDFGEAVWDTNVQNSHSLQTIVVPLFLGNSPDHFHRGE